MATFKFDRNGVPFEVDAADQATAESLLDDALRQRPGLLAQKATSLGMDFDFETNQASERSATDKFLIGAGRTFTEMAQFVGDAFSSEELSEMEEQARANEAKAYAALDEQGLGVEDFGEVAPMLIGTGTAGIKAGVATLRAAGTAGKAAVQFGLGFGLVGAALRHFVNSVVKKKVTGETMKDAVQSGAGRAAVRQMRKTKSPKTMDKLTDTVKKEATKVKKARRKKPSEARQRPQGETPPSARPQPERPAQPRRDRTQRTSNRPTPAQRVQQNRAESQSMSLEEELADLQRLVDQVNTSRGASVTIP